MARITREQQQSMDLISTASPTFVAPKPTERPPRAEIIMPGPSAAPQWETALQPVQSTQTRDSLSAEDRARGRLIDSIPGHAAILILAGFGALAFYRFGDVSRLDSFLAFLFFTGAAVLFYNANDIAERFRHTGAGVERFKVATAAEMYKAQLQHEAEVRRESLRLQLKLLEGPTDDDN